MSSAARAQPLPLPQSRPLPRLVFRLDRTLRNSRDTAWENLQVDLLFRACRDGNAVIILDRRILGLDQGEEAILRVRKRDLLTRNLFDDWTQSEFVHRLSAEVNSRVSRQNPTITHSDRRLVALLRSDGVIFAPEVLVILARANGMEPMLIHFSNISACIAARKIEQIARLICTKRIIFALSLAADRRVLRPP